MNSKKFQILLALIAGGFIIFGAICAGSFGIFNVIVDNNLAKQPTSTLAPTQYTIPTAGADINFSPNLKLGENVADVPETYDLIPGRFPGIYVSEIFFDTPPYSWRVNYLNGESVPADSEICLINKGFPGGMRSPLNLQVNDMSFEVGVFTDYRYMYDLTDMEILVNSYQPARTDVDFVEVVLPGAGGLGLPFQTVQTQKVKLEQSGGVIYKVDFKDFQLKPNQGVNFHVPMYFKGDGSYEFQVKINGVGNSVYQDNPSGKLTLTTGQFNYSWARLPDPRDYRTVANPSFLSGNSTSADVELIPCP